MSTVTGLLQALATRPTTSSASTQPFKVAPWVMEGSNTTVEVAEDSVTSCRGLTAAPVALANHTVYPVTGAPVAATAHCSAILPARLLQDGEEAMPLPPLPPPSSLTRPTAVTTGRAPMTALLREVPVLDNAKVFPTVTATATPPVKAGGSATTGRVTSLAWALDRARHDPATSPPLSFTRHTRVASTSLSGSTTCHVTAMGTLGSTYQVPPNSTASLSRTSDTTGGVVSTATPSAVTHTVTPTSLVTSRLR